MAERTPPTPVSSNHLLPLSCPVCVAVWLARLLFSLCAGEGWGGGI